jgi:ABC-type transport system involved in multi-copper enzyme maturation permease subunit
MTASTTTISSAAPATAFGRSLIGARPLVRKEFAEWRHSRRIWVIGIVSSLFMGLAVANSAINAWVIANLPANADVSRELSMDPLQNLQLTAGSQIYILAAIFAAMSLLVTERDRGTLAWVASKPVARPAIWFSKWVAGSTVVAISAVIVPVLVSLAAVVVLYGVPPALPVVGLTVGMIAVVALFTAVSLAASTVVGNQAAVAAIGFAAFFLPTVLVGIIPFDIAPFLPTSILSWAAGFASGAPVGFVTPIAFAVTLVALAVVGGRRLDAMEL